MNWHELSTYSPAKIVAWAAGQPWCQAMSACQQDAAWHAEGDVWTHTQMVCAQLQQLSEWQELSVIDQTTLVFTAIFHDSGKPMTSRTDPDTFRVTSPNHAQKGEQLARHVLRELDCPVTIREGIAQLVRYHGRPAFLLERPDPAAEVVSLSWLVNNRLLYLFALADTRGRSTASMNRPEENLHYWRLTGEENDCFTQPFPFGNDHARFLFYRSAKPDMHYVPHEDYCCTVTMLAGLPGSGKDTWLLKQRPELPVVSLDSIRGELEIDATANQGEVAQFARERCREFLRRKESFAFNATNLLRTTRKRWLDLFADYGARIEIVYLEPPLPNVLRQNKRRESPVPDRVIRSLAERCEPPTWTEVHHLSLVVDT